VRARACVYLFLFGNEWLEEGGSVLSSACFSPVSSPLLVPTCHTHTHTHTQPSVSQRPHHIYTCKYIHICTYMLVLVVVRRWTEWSSYICVATPMALLQRERARARAKKSERIRERQREEDLVITIRIKGKQIFQPSKPARNSPR
jgi:hypothetical protein